MFFRSLPLFTIFGFRVRLDVGWLLLALFIVISAAQRVMAPPLSFPARDAVLLGLFFALGLLFSIVVHELSHSLVARLHGIRVRSITLFMLGGVAETEKEAEEPGTEFLIAIVGPLCSVAVAGVLFGAAWGSSQASAPPFVQTLLAQLALMNLQLAIFNLVPAFPLDGGRVLRAALWKLKGDALWATRIAGWSGQAFGAVLIGLAIVLFVALQDYGAVMLAFIGWFVFKIAPLPYREMVVRGRLSAATVARFVDQQPIVVPHDLPVADLLQRTRALDDHEMLPVVQGGRIVGLVPLLAVRRMPEDERERLAALEVSRRLPGEAVVTTSTTAEEALNRMQRLQIPALLVVDAARLIGIVRWNDLLRFAERTA